MKLMRVIVAAMMFVAELVLGAAPLRAADVVEAVDVQAAVDRAAPNAWVQVRPGRGPAVTLRKAVFLSGVPGQAPPVLGGIQIQGNVSGVTVAFVDLSGGGISSVDGMSSCTFRDMRIQDCAIGIGIEQPAGSVDPVRDVTLLRVRVRHAARLGVIMGSCFGVTMREVWVDSAGVMGDESTHAFYINDASCTGKMTDCWATRSATGFRGTLTEAVRPFAYKDGWAIASSANAQRINAPLAMDWLHGAGLEVNAQGPLLVERVMAVVHGGHGTTGGTDAAGIATQGAMKCAYLEVRGGVLCGLGPRALVLASAPVDGHGIGRGDFSGLAIQNGFVGQEDVVYAGNFDRSWYRWWNVVRSARPEPVRTPELYDKEVLGGPGTLEHLWESPCDLGAVHAWMAEEIGG